MRDETKVDIDYTVVVLMSVADMLRREEMPNNASHVDNAANELKRMEADNARLRAEVERLTPKVMTLEGLARELNDLRYDDSDKWSVQDGGLVCGNDCECLLDPIHAISIVRFLRRDAAKGGAA